VSQLKTAVTNMPEPNLVLWQGAQSGPIAARIAIAGDFLPAGKLTLSRDDDWREMAHGLAKCFDDVNSSFLNLEATLDCEGLEPRRLNGIGEIVSAPSSALDYLREIHSEAVGIANNHCFDFGEPGVSRTRLAISANGMTPLGSGRTLAEPPEIFVWQGPGSIRVGFWAAASATLDPATTEFAGVEPATQARARQARGELKARGAQTCIALIHAGCLRTNRPDPEDVRLVDTLARCGFDLVAAAHSHRVSGFRQHGNRCARPSFCFYGLGSLVSGYVAGPLERDGLVVIAELNQRGELIGLQVRPVFIDESGFGVIPSQEIGREILRRFCQFSEELADGSFEANFYKDVSRGLLGLYTRDVSAAYRAAGVRGLVQKAGRIRVRHVRRLVHRFIG
jgi:poly-gamma-glutamate synthesis protein (capsule biosynthesis protein)